MYYDMDMVQINDGLTQCAACGSAVVYDKVNGLVFVAYMTGLPQHYGEATGKICLSVFNPGQPENARRRIIDEGVGQSRGLLFTAHYGVGDGRTRMLFTTTLGEEAAFYRDYDFHTDTVSERQEMFFRTEKGDVRLTKAAYKEYLAGCGLALERESSIIINKVSQYNGELYTAISCSYGYAILCKIQENVLVPFTLCPELMTYEFRYFRNDDGIFAMYRVPPDDTLTNHAAFTVSRDGGKTWNTTIFEDGVQSRPDIIEYYGKPLIVYNYKSDRSSENFPPMHNYRNAIKIVYDGKVVFDWFTKYGVVEYDFVNIYGDLYMAFSNSTQALSVVNKGGWLENGRGVEQAKEAIQWAKIGYLL
jgi:hypothetical protein